MELNVVQRNDLVTPRPFKDSTSTTSGPLFTIFNGSISQLFYLNSWKKGQLASVFKTMSFQN